MKKLLLGLLSVMRYIFLIIAAWQILGLIPVVTWISNPSAVTVGMWFAVGIKVIIFFVGFLLFWVLGKAVKKLNGANLSNAIPKSEAELHS